MKKITGLITLVASAVIVAGGWVYHVRNQPSHYQADGSPSYMVMESSSKNSPFDIAKAKIEANNNSISMFVGRSSSDEPEVDYTRTLEYELNTVVVEIPASNDDVENKSVHITPGGIERVIDLTKKVEVKREDRVVFKHSWLDMAVYDHDGVRNLEAYEIDPVTKENLRKMEFSTRPFTDMLEPKRKSVAIAYDKKGIGKAEMIKVEVTDFKGNEYHSFIQLVRK